MPADRSGWLDELSGRAPHSDRTLLRVVAGLLACGAPSGALQSTADALAAGVVELRRGGRLRLAGELLEVTMVVDVRLGELARRPGIWR